MPTHVRHRAASLTELIVVLIVIGIIGGIAYSSHASSRRDSERIADQEVAEQVLEMIETTARSDGLPTNLTSVVRAVADTQDDLTFAVVDASDSVVPLDEWAGTSIDRLQVTNPSGRNAVIELREHPTVGR